MKTYRRQDYPTENVRHYLEPGPVALITSACAGKRNVMTHAWQTVMEFSPSLVGCMISSANYSFELIRQSRECVINLPAADLVDVVSRVGNCSGEDTDKFARFGLTAVPATQVAAPLLDECFACFECVLYDDVLVDSYNFFIFEVVQAHVAVSPQHPQTLHYQGDGQYMLSGGHISRRHLFTKVL